MEPGDIVEIERIVAGNGMVNLAGQVVPAAEILAGRLVGIRVEDTTLSFFDLDTHELRPRVNPLSAGKARFLRGVRPAGPPPRPSIEPITV